MFDLDLFKFLVDRGLFVGRAQGYYLDWRPFLNGSRARIMRLILLRNRIGVVQFLNFIALVSQILFLHQFRNAGLWKILTECRLQYAFLTIL